MNDRHNGKIPYICGPLTELPLDDQAHVKRFYERLADACKDAWDVRAFVPHEHYDPVRHADFTPAQVDAAERRQVCERTSVLVAAAIAPTWGGGIEVEMAYRSGVPIILLCNRAKLAARKISRLLRGNPGVWGILTYDTEDEAIWELRIALAELANVPTPSVKR